MSSNRRHFLRSSLATAALGGLGSIAGAGRADELPAGEVVFQRRLAVRHEVDVFVAGGGPAGVAAAVAAARQGARVFLAERNTCLGGMGTAGLLPLFMPFSDGIRNLAGGIGEDHQSLAPIVEAAQDLQGFNLSRVGLPMPARCRMASSR